MITQSAWTGLAKAAGCLGVVLLMPLNAGAAEITGKATAVQPPGMIKPVQAPPVVTAPPVALPKPGLTPVMTKPITPGPITIQPVKTDPIRVAKPDVLRPTGPTKLPATPISRIDGPSAEGVSPSVSAAMLEQQKQANKEAREQRKLSKELKQQSLDAKRGKLKLDNESIQAGRDEASQKADNAMDAADAAMALGVGSGAQQLGAGGLRDKREAVNAGKGDVETLVMTVLQETSKDTAADLKDMTRELKDTNAAKKSLQAAKGDDGGKQDKEHKTVATAVKPAAGPVAPKTSLVGRPCTPINPC
jgi:hypothetical protein